MPAIRLTLTDPAGAPVSDVVVRCDPLEQGSIEEARYEGGGVFACGDHGGAYALLVWFHSVDGPLLVDRTLPVSGHFCNGATTTLPVAITVTIPPPSDAGSPDAGHDV
jgi:hypothetical protein